MAIGRDVGDVYMDVHARTGPFRRELRRDARRAANDASNQMENEFDPDFGIVGNRMRKQMKKFGTLSGEDFTNAVRKVLDSRGKSIADSFARAIATGDYSAFIAQFDDMGDATRQFNRSVEALKRSGVLVKGEYQAVNRSFRDYKKTLDNSAAAAAALQRNQDKLAASNARLRDIQKDMGAQARADVRAQRASEKAIRDRTAARQASMDLEVEFGEALRGVIEELQSTDNRFRRLTRNVVRNSDRIKSVLRTTLRVDSSDTSAIASISEAVDRMGAKARVASRGVHNLNRGLGRLKDGRNDFLHLIGSLDQFVRGRVLRTMDALLGSVGEGFHRLGDRMSQVRGPLGNLGGIFSKIGDRIQGAGSSVDGLVVQLILAAASVAAFIAIAGPLAALLTALTGSFVALTVAVGGAIGGGLIALGPMLYAVAAGAGAVALALSDMSKKQKQAFEPFKDWAEEARGIVQEKLFSNIGKDIEGIVSVLSKSLNPMLASTAEVIREAFGQFAAVIQGESFQGSMKILQVELPTVLDSLLTLAGNLGIGLTNLFAAAAPAAQIFLERINGVVERFAAWTGDEAGRESINSFMTDAVDLLGSIWGLITSVSETFRIFWTEGNEYGQRMIDNLAGIVDEFNEWIGSKAGRDRLKKWFEDAQIIIGEVGDVLRRAGELIDALDSPVNRAGLLLILNMFQNIIAIIKQLVDWVNNVTTKITGIGQKGGRSLAQVQRALDKVSHGFRNIGDVARNVADRIKNVFSRISLQNIGSAIIGGLKAGLQRGAIGLLAYAAQLAARVAAAFAGALRISSPSRVFRDYGEDITDGLVLGMQSGRREVQNTAAGLIDQDALANINTPLGRMVGQDAPAARSDRAAQNWGGGITIVTPYADPRLVALETVDALAARGR